MRSSSAASRISSSRAIAPWAKLAYARSASAGPRQQPERLSQPIGGAGQLAAREQLARLVHQPLEAREVELRRARPGWRSRAPGS